MLTVEATFRVSRSDVPNVKNGLLVLVSLFSYVLWTAGTSEPRVSTRGFCIAWLLHCLASALPGFCIVWLFVPVSPTVAPSFPLAKKPVNADRECGTIRMSHFYHFSLFRAEGTQHDNFSSPGNRFQRTFCFRTDFRRFGQRFGCSFRPVVRADAAKRTRASERASGPRIADDDGLCTRQDRRHPRRHDRFRAGDNGPAAHDADPQQGRGRLPRSHANEYVSSRSGLINRRI